MSKKEVFRIIFKYPFDILSLIWFGVSILFSYLWCKIVGHKFIDSHISKERDGCIEVYEICERCLKEKHTTIYDCDDYSPGDLINVVIIENKDKDE
jgi:hypothetical protein